MPPVLKGKNDEEVMIMEAPKASKILVEVKDLKKYFPVIGGVFGKVLGYVYAVDGVNFSIKKGETLGLVGESGCGKTTVGRCILRLIEPTAGEVYFDGQNILELKRREMRKLRREMQIVFQDPYASLNPRLTIKDIVGEPLMVYGVAKGPEIREMVLTLLKRVGLSEDHLNRFPHEFSGGQRQRICIARALALNPKFIILDEPTSSTDVSVQAQTLNLLQDLQKELGLTYLFISHNLSVIEHISNRIAVMYLGKIVEISRKSPFEEREHPYTQALFSALPIPAPDVKTYRMLLTGEVPNPTSPPPGCRFHPRCPKVMPKCRTDDPKLVDIGDGHLVACHLVT